jgi:hypothetical protein
MTFQEGWSKWKGDPGNYKERIKGEVGYRAGNRNGIYNEV